MDIYNVLDLVSDQFDIDSKLVRKFVESLSLDAAQCHCGRYLVDGGELKDTPCCDKRRVCNECQLIHFAHSCRCTGEYNDSGDEIECHHCQQGCSGDDCPIHVDCKATSIPAYLDRYGNQDIGTVNVMPNDETRHCWKCDSRYMGEHPDRRQMTPPPKRVLNMCPPCYKNSSWCSSRYQDDRSW